MFVVEDYEPLRVTRMGIQGCVVEDVVYRHRIFCRVRLPVAAHVFTCFDTVGSRGVGASMCRDVRW